LWALGILLFELRCGYFPFADEEEDPFDVYKILSKEQAVEFDDEMTDEVEMDFIRQLLDYTPEKRLHGGYAGLMTHPYFKNVDWVLQFHLHSIITLIHNRRN